MFEAGIDLIGFHGKVKFNELCELKIQLPSEGERKRISHFEESIRFLPSIRLRFGVLRWEKFFVCASGACERWNFADVVNSYSVHVDLDRASSRPVHSRERKGAISRLDDGNSRGLFVPSRNTFTFHPRNFFAGNQPSSLFSRRVSPPPPLSSQSSLSFKIIAFQTSLAAFAKGVYATAWRSKNARRKRVCSLPHLI